MADVFPFQKLQQEKECSQRTEAWSKDDQSKQPSSLHLSCDEMFAFACGHLAFATDGLMARFTGRVDCDFVVFEWKQERMGKKLVGGEMRRHLVENTQIENAY